MRLALWQTEGHSTDKAANLAALSRIARAVATARAKLCSAPNAG